MPVRRRPRASLRALEAALSTAVVVRGNRGEARETAHALLRAVDRILAAATNVRERCRMKPERRRDGLVVTPLEGEVLVYDLDRHRAHCLNETAARVFERCDGQTSVRDLARALPAAGRGPAGESVVWLALERLDKAHLLRDAPRAGGRPAKRLSRRELIRGAAVASALLLPVITSVVAPTPAEAAATCVANCAAKPFGTPCSSTAPANCLCTCDGAGNCVGGC